MIMITGVVVACAVAGAVAKVTRGTPRVAPSRRTREAVGIYGEVVPLPYPRDPETRNMLALSRCIPVHVGCDMDIRDAFHFLQRPPKMLGHRGLGNCSVTRSVPIGNIAHASAVGTARGPDSVVPERAVAGNRDGVVLRCAVVRIVR